MKLTKKQREMIEWFCDEKYGGELDEFCINEDTEFVVATDPYGNKMEQSIKETFYDMQYFCQDQLYDNVGDLETMDFWYEKLYETIKCEIELGF